MPNLSMLRFSSSKAEHHPVLYILSSAHFSHQEHSPVLGYPVPSTWVSDINSKAKRNKAESETWKHSRCRGPQLSQSHIYTLWRLVMGNWKTSIDHRLGTQLRLADPNWFTLRESHTQFANISRWGKDADIPMGMVFSLYCYAWLLHCLLVFCQTPRKRLLFRFRKQPRLRSFLL